MIQKNKTKDYYDGYLDCLRDFAVWKDGTQLVGCGVYTLEQVEAELHEAYMTSKRIED